MPRCRRCRTTTSMPPAARASRRWARPASSRPSVPAEHGGLHPRLDVRTLCLAREILAFRDGLADFAFAMQGLGTGSISLFGSAELKARYLPPVRDGKRHRGFRAVRAGGRLRRRGAGDDGDAGRAVACSHRRQQDLDLERRHRRSLRGLRPHRRRRRRQGAFGLRGRCRHARPARRRAHRGDRAASARDARASTACACRSRNRLGQAGRRLQGRDGDARHLPLDRRRRRARLRPPRAA